MNTFTLTLDPGDPATKVHIKASITDAIAKQAVGCDRADVARRVEAEYERLLNSATILTMIPSLTAGFVRRQVIAGLE